MPAWPQTVLASSMNTEITQSLSQTSPYIPQFHKTTACWWCYGYEINARNHPEHMPSRNPFKMRVHTLKQEHGPKASQLWDWVEIREKKQPSLRCILHVSMYDPFISEPICGYYIPMKKKGKCGSSLCMCIISQDLHLHFREPEITLLNQNQGAAPRCGWPFGFPVAGANSRHRH